jgi:hypothetical protein
MKKTFKTTIVREGSMCFIPVSFDPRPVFGKVRAPVKVTLNGYTYRSTIASMGNLVAIPLRRSNREAAGLQGGEALEVTLSYSHQREHVEAIEGAKKPETRTRRIEGAVRMVAARPAKSRK